MSKYNGDAICSMAYVLHQVLTRHHYYSALNNVIIDLYHQATPAISLLSVMAPLMPLMMLLYNLSGLIPFGSCRAQQV